MLFFSWRVPLIICVQLDENIARLIHMLEEPPPPAKVPPVPAFRYCDVTVVQPDLAEHATAVCVRQRRCDKERCEYW